MSEGPLWQAEVGPECVPAAAAGSEDAASAIYREYGVTMYAIYRVTICRETLTMYRHTVMICLPRLQAEVGAECVAAAAAGGEDAASIILCEKRSKSRSFW